MLSDFRKVPQETVPFSRVLESSMLCKEEKALLNTWRRTLERIISAISSLAVHAWVIICPLHPSFPPFWPQDALYPFASSQLATKTSEASNLGKTNLFHAI